MSHRPSHSPCRRNDRHDAHEFEVYGRPFWCPGYAPTGPACGNNPNHPLTDGDRQAVENFRARLTLQAAAKPYIDRAVWVDGDPLMEVIAVTLWEHCARDDQDMPQAVCDDPRTIAAFAAAVVRAYTEERAPTDQPAEQQPAPHRQIADRLDLECARRVKAAWSPEEATAAREWGNVAAFVRGLAPEEPAPPGVIAYSPGGRTLRCLNCRPDPLGSDWRAPTSSDLEHGGICTVCGVDVLIEEQQK